MSHPQCCHIIRCGANKSCTAEFVFEVFSYSSEEVLLYFCVILEMPGGSFRGHCETSFIAVITIPSFQQESFPSVIKGLCLFLVKQNHKAHFHVSIVSRVSTVSSVHPPSPAIPNNVSFLRLKDTCFLFPAPFFHLAGRARKSKVVLGLLVICMLILLVLSHQRAVRWPTLEEILKVVWQLM